MSKCVWMWWVVPIMLFSGYYVSMQHVTSVLCLSVFEELMMSCFYPATHSALTLTLCQDNVTLLLQGCKQKLSVWLQENSLTIIGLDVGLILIQVIKPVSVYFSSYSQDRCEVISSFVQLLLFFPPPCFSISLDDWDCCNGLPVPCIWYKRFFETTETSPSHGQPWPHPFRTPGWRRAELRLCGPRFRLFIPHQPSTLQHDTKNLTPPTLSSPWLPEPDQFWSYKSICRHFEEDGQILVTSVFINASVKKTEHQHQCLLLDI